MKTSTMLGLFAGGAILVLTAAPRSAGGAIAYPGSGQVPAAPGPGGNLNPFNWLSQLGQPGGQPAGYLPGASYAPASGGAYAPANTNYSGGGGSSDYVPSGYEDASYYMDPDSYIPADQYGTPFADSQPYLNSANWG